MNMVCMIEDGLGNHIIFRDNLEMQNLSESISKLSKDMVASKYMEAMEKITKTYMKSPKEVYNLMSTLSMVTKNGNKKIHLAFMEE